MERFLTLFQLFTFAFFITLTSGQDHVCPRPELGGNIEVENLQMYFNPGEVLVLSCKQGYTPVSGPMKIICSVEGEWTKTRLLCNPKRCPYPEPVSNGDLYYEDVTYKSTINYTCDEGYTLIGSSTAECLANGTWSSLEPTCKLSVSCDLAPIPQNGMISYDRKISGNTVDYGVRGTYRCRPPYALFGNPFTECTISGTWTKTPECRVVTCPPPQNIEHGFMSSSNERVYDYMENVKYGCHGDYTLEGSFQVFCQRDGQWSERPSCKAPCTVGISRGRILYKAQKLWINDLKPNRIMHREMVSVYCLNKARNCGYAVPIQCINGKLDIPDCFEEPGVIEYSIRESSLPSEIQQC